MNAVFFLLGDFPASECCVTAFLNTLSYTFIGLVNLYTAYEYGTEFKLHYYTVQY